MSVIVNLNFTPTKILLDCRGVYATNEFSVFSPSRVRFYLRRMEDFLADGTMWHKDKHIPGTGHLRNIYQMAKAYQAAREQRGENRKYEPRLADLKAEKQDKRITLFNYIKFHIDHQDVDDVPTGLFLEKFQDWGYRNNFLVTPVYNDVKSTCERWKNMGIQVYLDTPSDSIFERVTEKTNIGNLRNLFSGFANPNYLDNEPFSNTIIKSSQGLLMVTHSTVVANEAHHAGIPVVVMVRDDMDPDYVNRLRKEKAEVDHDMNKVQKFNTDPIIGSSTMSEVSKASNRTNSPKMEITADELNELLNMPVMTVEKKSSKITLEDTKTFLIVKSLYDIRFPPPKRINGSGTGSRPGSPVGSRTGAKPGSGGSPVIRTESGSRTKPGTGMGNRP